MATFRLAIAISFYSSVGEMRGLVYESSAGGARVVTEIRLLTEEILMRLLIGVRLHVDINYHIFPIIE